MSRDKFKILGAPSISQEWLKLEPSIFFTKGDYIKSCQKDDKSPLKGAKFFSRDPFLSAQLWTKKKFRRRTLLAVINKIYDGPPCLSRLRRSTI